MFNIIRMQMDDQGTGGDETKKPAGDEGDTTDTEEM